MIWTEAHDKQIRIHFRKGGSASELAERFGVTRNMVCGRKHRLGIFGGKQRQRAWSPDDTAKLRSLRFAGKKNKEIAAVLDRSEMQVSWKSMRIGLPRRIERIAA